MALPNRNSEPFSWVTYDVTKLLPPGWQAMVDSCVEAGLQTRQLVPTSVTSREAEGVQSVAVATVPGNDVRDRLPWLWRLYHEDFVDLANVASCEPVRCASRDRIKVNLNVQRGSQMRYECHVDSNPIEGLLYLTTHAPGDGGELVVSNRQHSIGVEEIDDDCTIIYPVAGHLVLFDAREFPHYVRPLRDSAAVRVVAAMNYYTDSWPETNRPADLDAHLFGDEQEQRRA